MCKTQHRYATHALFAVCALLAVPFFLNRRFRVARRIIIRASPEEIFPYLNDLQLWSKWTAWARREPVDFFYKGPSAGVGAGQEWRTKRMIGETRIVQSVPGEQVAYHADIGGRRGYHSHFDGILTLEAFGGLTRVTWLCRWDNGPNPYARYLGLVTKLFLKHDFDSGLANLKALLENPAL